MTVTVDASLSRASSLVSDCHSADTQKLVYRRRYKDTNPPCYFEVRWAASAIDVQLADLDSLSRMTPSTLPPAPTQTQRVRQMILHGLLVLIMSS